MSKQVELIQRGSVRDTVGNVSEACRHREQNVLGGRNSAERAELANRVVPAPNAIEQPVTH